MTFRGGWGGLSKNFLENIFRGDNFKPPPPPKIVFMRMELFKEVVKQLHTQVQFS